MVKRLKRISPLQLGKVLGILYALFSLFLIPFFLLAGFLGAMAPNSTSGASALGIGFSIFLALLAPIVYGIMGFILGALMGWLYNVVAGWTGGIEFEVE